jgi:hypothetical protein
MKPPVLMYYAIGPFYQNFNDYLKSESTKELLGQNVPEGVRDTFCTEQTRKDSNGDNIVPCGMKATSMFNDTFNMKLEDKALAIDSSNIAWAEDVERYRNPEDYKERKKTSWLYERYPNIVGKDEGVNNEHFATWMRPSALQRVWNPYGIIWRPLKKREMIELTIENNYPMHKFHGWKQVVLTTTNLMGGRHNGFGLFMVISGVGCFILCLVVVVLEQCNMKPKSGDYERINSQA